MAPAPITVIFIASLACSLRETRATGWRRSQCKRRGKNRESTGAAWDRSRAVTRDLMSIREQWNRLYEAKGKSVRHFGGRPNALSGKRKLVQRVRSLASCIVDGGAQETRSSSKLDHRRGNFRLIAEALAKIGADRQVSGGRDGRHVRHHLIAIGSVVEPPGGESVACTCGCERLESEMRK